jgi:hypothetical protein
MRQFRRPSAIVPQLSRHLSMSRPLVIAENDKDADFCDIAALCEKPDRRLWAIELIMAGASRARIAAPS